MMQLSLFKYWLFFLLMTGIEGFEKLWKPDDSFVTHKITKTILETCYKNKNLINPIVIIGSFKESIGESPFIKLDESYNFDEEIRYESVLGNADYVANKIILIEDSPKKLQSDLTLLQRTRWWNHMGLFFIIEKNVETCDNAMDMLITTWGMNILNSIYICTEPNKTAALYTFNPIANYAPSPWIRKEKRDHLYMFHQMFDSNIACESLHYDKTKNLHGYGVTALALKLDLPNSYPRRKYFDASDNRLGYPPLWAMIYSIFHSWNATLRLDFVDSSSDVMKRLQEGTADILMRKFVENIVDHGTKVVIPTNVKMQLIVIGEFRQEVSTLTEIHQLWSSTVLIGAVIVLATLLIMLTLQKRSFSIAVLDLIRLLTRKSISADNRSRMFRIYFTTVLFSIIITYGVFQGFIVTFLIKPERVSLPRTVDKLLESGYTHIEDPHGCPLCLVRSKAGLAENCSSITMVSVQYETCDGWFLWTHTQKSELDVGNLDFIEEPLASFNAFFVHRRNWPLQNAFAEKVLRISESGLPNFWGKFENQRRLSQYQSGEAKTSSTQYHPLKLNELTFAFKVLGIGLSISTIVFFIELIVANY